MPSEHRASAQCRRCRARYESHLDETRLCPDGSGWSFAIRDRRTRRLSQSFTPTEVAVLEHLLEGLLRGADPRPFARIRAREVAKLASKVAAMKRTLHAREQALAESRQSKAS